MKIELFIIILTETTQTRHRASTSIYSLTFRVRRYAVMCTACRYARRYCHINETRTPIANPPISAQLEGIPTIPPSYIRVRAVVWECVAYRQTETHTQTRVTTIHFASSTTHAKCN